MVFSKTDVVLVFRSDQSKKNRFNVMLYVVKLASEYFLLTACIRILLVKIHPPLRVKWSFPTSMS